MSLWRELLHALCGDPCHPLRGHRLTHEALASFALYPTSKRDLVVTPVKEDE